MIGIIIINYKKYDVTINCIQSVLDTAADLDYKIYLLDNGSGNESLTVLKERFSDRSQIEFIASTENLGYARGNNLCLKLAEKDGCDIAVVTNSDIEFLPGTLQTLAEDIRTQDCLIAAPLLRFPSGGCQKSVKLKPYTYKEYIFYETYFRNFVPKRKLLANNPLPKAPQPVYWVSGAVFAADLQKFKSIGWFDPFTFLYYEEYILSEKAKQHGYTIYFDPTVTALHCHGASAGGSANLFTRLENLRSELYFLNRFRCWSKHRLQNICRIRRLEVLFTFTKAGKAADAKRFLKQSRVILKRERFHEN